MNTPGRRWHPTGTVSLLATPVGSSTLEFALPSLHMYDLRRELLSIVIPARNEASTLPACLDSIARSSYDARRHCPSFLHEVVVADASSTDATRKIAANGGARVVRVPATVAICGRGAAVRAGVDATSGAMLLILHADTQIAIEALLEVRQFLLSADETEGAKLPQHRSSGIATLRPQFIRPPCPRQRWCTTRWCECLYWSSLERFCASHDSSFATFGDAGCATLRVFWESVGGIPSWPLFDDVELFRRLRLVPQTTSRNSFMRSGRRVVKLRSTILISSRRFEKVGMARYPLLCLVLIARWFLGAPPQDLALAYERATVAR